MRRTHQHRRGKSAQVSLSCRKKKEGFDAPEERAFGDVSRAIASMQGRKKNVPTFSRSKGANLETVWERRMGGRCHTES